MPRADLVLLHAPSVYDFRESSIMFGPVSDVVPSTPVFEMYPLGFTTLADYLERQGFTVRIVNLALLMLNRRSFDVEKAIQKMSPEAFGIDLHWLPHAHGSIEIARLVKKHHPDTPVVFGGLTASYYHEELIEYPCVDYVVRGDSTEEPMNLLMQALRSGGSVSDIPNLTWKSAEGSVQTNELSWVPGDVDHVSMDYAYNMRAVIRHRSLMEFVPFRDWLRYPVCAAITSRGCSRNCVTCGGSATAFRDHFGRKRPAFRDPALIVRDVEHMQRYIPGPVFVLNDPLAAGEDYAKELVRGLGTLDLKNHVAFEFFRPPGEDFWAHMDAHLPAYSAELSMESHDDGVRAAFGKHYAAREVEDSIASAFAHGCHRFDLYFMSGIPTQTTESVRGTVDYVERLYERVGGNPGLLPLLTPMAPTLDPGSMVFEDPDRFGYTLRARTLEEHRALMTQPSWKHILNYEPDAMTRDELVDSTYEAALGLNRVKAKYGAIGTDASTVTERRIHAARDLMSRIDDAMCADTHRREMELRTLRHEVEQLNESTVCDKRELDWPARASFLQALNVAALWVKETSASLFG